MTLEQLNNAPITILKRELERCCGAKAWVTQMAASVPFESTEKLYDRAEHIWYNLHPVEWMQAFTAHPKIGDVEQLRQKFAETAEWASQEQGRAIAAAGEATLQKLAELNTAYEEKFGYIFIIYATGKSADEMLAALQQRLQNNAEDELKIAITEQMKITRLRLEKLLAEA